jgi:hypothetical protein
MQIMVDQNLRNVETFIYLGSTITNHARCTREIKFSFTMANTAFKQEENFFQQQVGRKFKKENSKVLPPERSFIRC